jgi:transposase
MDMTTLFTMALNLQAPWQVQDLCFDPEGHRLDIILDFTRGAEFPCPICNQPCKVHDTQERTWRHMDFFQHSAYLTARVPRCTCDEHGVKQVNVPWARPGSGFTLLFEALAMMLMPTMPMNAAARLLREHDTRLWRIAHHYTDEARTQVDMSKVKEIGIDETAGKRGHNYISLMVDMVKRKLLFAVEGKGHETLKAFKADLEAHGGDADNIREASLDMSKSFIKGLREFFPKAHLTFDRFHVMKLLGEAVDEVRRKEVKERPELKKTRYIWLKNPSNLTAKQMKSLNALQDANLLTAEAYRLKLTFQDLYYQCNHKNATQFLDEWIVMAEASGLEPMIKVASTIKEHKEGVLRWFKSGLTNGILEGINSLIQAAKAKARGYRTTRNLITMAYLIAAKLSFNLPSLWPAPSRSVRRRIAKRPLRSPVLA